MNKSPAIAIALLTAASASAQEIVDLDPFVVTASGFSQKLSDAPASISTLTSQELGKRAYSDITDALTDVIVTNDNISIRGMPVAYTALLVDGKKQSGRETQPSGGSFETSLNHEISLHYSSPKSLQSSFAVFHNDFENKLSTVDRPADDGSRTYLNIDQAVTYGAEATFSVSPIDPLRLSASYTYTHSEQKSGANAGQPLT